MFWVYIFPSKAKPGLFLHPPCTCTPVSESRPVLPTKQVLPPAALREATSTLEQGRHRTHHLIFRVAPGLSRGFERSQFPSLSCWKHRVLILQHTAVHTETRFRDTAITRREGRGHIVSSRACLTSWHQRPQQKQRRGGRG